MHLFTALILILLIGVLVDVLIGDPRHLYHPVQAIAALARRVEHGTRTLLPHHLLPAGILYTAAVLLTVLLLLSTLFVLLLYLHHVLALLFGLYLTATMLAYGSLTRELRAVATALASDDTDRARAQAQGLVSRDLTNADRGELIAAALESGTENASDGIAAPLFFYALGGPICMVLYKTVNTLDSLVGYRSDAYRAFGWASARLDDVANYLPARLTGMVFLLTSFIYRDDARAARLAWQRDAHAGPSPNGGIPIVTFAGARDITLGNRSGDEHGASAVPAVGGSKAPTVADLHALIHHLRLFTVACVCLVSLWLLGIGFLIEQIP
jgi:adenosylcobinamide-phosphate synthase